MSNIRVRLAPSPTGFFHIGNAKTALINWLFARSTGGTFVLRLEDTDTERSRPEYAAIICEALKWLGIDWDEGPAFGDEPERGAYGPYRQSERKHLYRAEAMRLIEEGKAYRCYCTKEELDQERERARAEKRPPRYSGKCRNLTPAEQEARGSRPFSIRFKVPPGVTEIADLVQGRVATDHAEFDDFIIMKPNGDAVFHLAVVVDDGLMRITHVIRGDDHLTNATRHVMLFRALGYALPTFAHLPMVLDERGQKYSKRLHGANVLDWRGDGFLPEALVNYLVLLGWTPGDDREVFSREELVRVFSLDRLGQSPGKFDYKRLLWLNGQHIRRLTPEELCARVLPLWCAAGFDVDARPRAWLVRMAGICQDRIPTLNDIVPYTDFFFREPESYEEKAVNKQWRKAEAADTLEAVRDILSSVQDFTHDGLKAAYEAKAAETGKPVAHYIHPTRLALTGKSVGPGLFELAELLGRETCMRRINRAIAYVRSLKEAQR